MAQQRRLLEGLGVTVAEETAYRALLRHGPATLSELAAETGSSAAAIRRMLPRLEDLGLISRVAGRPLRLVATPPNIAIDILVARRQEELTHSRAAAALLATEVADRGGPHPEEVLEVVTGRDAVARRYLQLERNATREMLVLVHPPYAVDISDDRENRRRAARQGAPSPAASTARSPSSSPACWLTPAVPSPTASRPGSARCRSSSPSPTPAPPSSRWSPTRTAPWRAPWSCTRRRCWTRWWACSRRCGGPPSRCA
ncbi:TrmB family transcriptional regulator [Nonomuraea thailandensis]